MDIDPSSSLPEQSSGMDVVPTSYSPSVPGAPSPQSHHEQGSGMDIAITSPPGAPPLRQPSHPPQPPQPHTMANVSDPTPRIQHNPSARPGGTPAERRPIAPRIRVRIGGDPASQMHDPNARPLGEIQTGSQLYDDFEDADEIMDEASVENTLIRRPQDVPVSRPRPPRYRSTVEQLRMMRRGEGEQEDYYRELSQWGRHKLHEITTERDNLLTQIERYAGFHAHYEAVCDQYQELRGQHQQTASQYQQQSVALASLHRQLELTKVQAEERVVSMQQTFDQEKEGHRKQIQELEQQWRGRCDELQNTTESRIAALEHQLAARPPARNSDISSPANVPQSPVLLTTPRLRARTPGPVLRPSPSPYAAVNFQGNGRLVPRHRKLMSVVPLDTTPLPQNRHPANHSQNRSRHSTSPMSPGSPRFHTVDGAESDQDEPVTRAYLHSALREIVDAIKSTTYSPPRSHGKTSSRPIGPSVKRSHVVSEAPVDTDDEGSTLRRRKPINKFADITKELFKETFGIKHDTDILLYETVDLTGGTPDFDESDPQLDLLGTAKSDWNRKVIHFLLDIGLKLQEEEYPGLMSTREKAKKEDKKLFEAAIANKFTRLRQRWRASLYRRKPDGTLETEQEAATRMEEVSNMTNKRARHTRRRSERYDRRRRIAEYQVHTADDEHSQAIWKWIGMVLEDLGEKGMSSDESELEEGSLTQSFRTKKLPWRRNLDDVLTLVDETRRLQGNGFKNQGCLPVDRTRDGELITEDRVVSGLPVNLYDEAWLAKQSKDYIDLELDPSEIRYPIHNVVST